MIVSDTIEFLGRQYKLVMDEAKYEYCCSKCALDTKEPVPLCERFEYSGGTCMPNGRPGGYFVAVH